VNGNVRVRGLIVSLGYQQSRRHQGFHRITSLFYRNYTIPKPSELLLHWSRRSDRAIQTMRIAVLLLALFASPLRAQTISTFSALDLPLEQRLDLPLRVASTSLRLTDFVSFIATTFKVPLLVETPAPVPILKTPEGTYSARQLLDMAITQLPRFAWKDEGGVAQIYGKGLVAFSGNLLNVRIPQFSFSRGVGEFMYLFLPCINSVIQRYGCRGGAYSGFQLPKLRQGGLPYGQTFTNEDARSILLTALKANGRFYVLIAFERTQPKLRSQYPFANWFAESLEVDEPSPMWVQTPKSRIR